MPKPIVAVVGRPNVGKSTLFNRIIGAKIAIVDDAPGITRDRLYADTEWLNRQFTLIDTGGLDPDADDPLTRHVYRQAEAAIESADVILFLCDIKSGVVDADRQVADVLRRSKKPVVLAVNKVDVPSRENNELYEFYELGIGEPVPISAGQALNLGDMLDEIVGHFPAYSEEDEDDGRIKVAIVGKPNVGKSSLINKILGEERVIVSDIPGTTRDAVDTFATRDGHEFLFIDTAGLRRKSRIKENIERYSIIRAIAAIERCDVCVLLIDADEGISEQDTKIAGIAHERGRAAIIAVNKWDKIEKDDKTMKEHTEKIARELSYMPYAPMLFISALTGQRINKLFGMIHAAYQNHAMRIATGTLNEVIIEATAIHTPPTDKGRALRIYYVTQVSIKPPTFVLFVNDRRLMHFSYERFLENRIREAFGFDGTPIHLIVRNRGEKE
ncbi:MAG: ribosome biogenesis GTPase Der [Defluviitaleaceae bacterium]|nr:ribosome biogenesis GTPase Der [Defluviitaleaceae bacterium]MCL2274849.1 ribosome biogenesis GTPase Der [Defluviitaleaceae bacterium]